MELTELNIKQVAAELGVHYMTAYRYVRTGRLAARKVGTGWVVRAADLERFVHEPISLLLSDEATTGSTGKSGCASRSSSVTKWRPGACSNRRWPPAIAPPSAISISWSAPSTTSAVVLTYPASPMPANIWQQRRQPGWWLVSAPDSGGPLGVGALFVFGAPIGEHHVLPISVVADLVRLNGFSCLELGADVPPAAFAGAARSAHRLVAVGIGVTTATNLDVVTETVDAVHAVDPEIPVVLGGRAAAEPDAANTGVTAWVLDGTQAVEIFTESRPLTAPPVVRQRLRQRRRSPWRAHGLRATSRADRVPPGTRGISKPAQSRITQAPSRRSPPPARSARGRSRRPSR